MPLHTGRTLHRSQALLTLLLFALALYFPLGCAVTATSNLNTQVQANQSATSTTTVSPQFFDLVVRDTQHQPSIETGARRLWDSGVTWAAIEPSAGVFKWTQLDAEVSAALAYGNAVTLTLGMTPTWASSQPTVASSFGAGATAAPARLSDWDAYVTAVATRYAGRISAYEVWNTPEDATYWSGSAQQLGTRMAALSAHAEAAIHAADPKAVVVAPAFTGAGLQLFLTAGGGTSVDAIALAPQLNGQAPEVTLAAVAAIRATMNDTSVAAKPLWTIQPLWSLTSDVQTPELEAAFVARALILNASAGVERVSWYAWDETTAGSLQLTDSNAQPTHAATAYATVESWLTGAAMNGCSADASSTWTCQIVRNGKPAWILWNPAQTINSSSLGATTSTDLNGLTQGVSATVSIGPSPLLLQ